jgi:hypothetical protein
VHSHGAAVALHAFSLCPTIALQGDPALPLLSPEQRQSVALLARCLADQPHLIDWIQRQVGEKGKMARLIAQSHTSTTSLTDLAAQRQRCISTYIDTFSFWPASMPGHDLSDAASYPVSWRYLPRAPHINACLVVLAVTPPPPLPLWLSTPAGAEGDLWPCGSERIRVSPWQKTT